MICGLATGTIGMRRFAATGVGGKIICLSAGPPHTERRGRSYFASGRWAPFALESVTRAAGSRGMSRIVARPRRPRNPTAIRRTAACSLDIPSGLAR